MTTHRRTVRSFVRRGGRLTAAQAEAIETLLPRWGVAPPAAGETLALEGIFGRTAPRVLEIGFGDGESLAAMAEAAPDTDFLGIEVHEPGVGHLLLTARRLGLENVRVIVHDAVEVLAGWLAPGSFDRVQLFFPDPWPKKRHHKRRIVQPAFLEDVARLLREGGSLHLATDWAPYAEHMRETVAAVPWFDDTGDPGRGARPETKFERRGLGLGHGVEDLRYRRNAAEVTPRRSPP